MSRLVLILTLALFARLAAGPEPFASDDFAAVEEACRRALEENPDDTAALAGLGRLALFENRLDEAEGLLLRVLELDPEDHGAVQNLAMVYYRRDDYPRAATWLRKAGLDAFAASLEDIGDKTPYAADGPEETTVPFVVTDPLPVVPVSVNGGEPVNFLIDTGARELVLDEEFAEAVGAHVCGTVTGTFAGGMQAEFAHGAVDSVTVGGITVHDVPVDVKDMAMIKPMFGDLDVRGIVGTMFLYHFTATLDYAAGELVLRSKGEGADVPPGAEEVPFILAGDHYMFARGTIEGSDPMYFLVDTGLAGGGFVAAASTVEALGLELPEETIEGVGGGGAVRVTPFVVGELTLGGVVEHDINAFYGASPPDFESRFGFPVGGIISHQFFRDHALTLDFVGMRYIIE